VTRKSVIGQRLPGGSVSRVLVPLRPDARIVVERSQPHAHVVARARRSAEQRRSAPSAEDLLEPALGRPRAQLVLAGENANAVGLYPGVRRRCRPGPTLATRAVAVRSGDKRRRHLEADGATAATPGDDRAHSRSLAPSRTRAPLSSALWEIRT